MSRNKVKIVELDNEDAAPIDTKQAPKKNPFAGKSIYLAVPCYGCLLHNSFLASLLSLQMELSKVGVPIFIDLFGNESLIHRARNVLTARFLKSSATHMMFIDADIGFDPATVLRMLEFDQPIVSCAYPKKSNDFDRVVQKVLENDDEAVKSIQSCGLDYNVNIDKDVSSSNGFVEVLDAATGFLLMERRALETICKAYDPELRVVNDIISSRADVPEYIDIWECVRDPIGDQGQKRLLSEDYSFSRKAQKCGFVVWMDLASVIAHSGNVIQNGNIKDRLKKKVSYTLD
jgi:hypothetical protein